MQLDLVKNPFFVLELDTGASAVDVERQGRRLLAEIELGRSAATTFPSPFGRQARDEGAVRAAMAALRDPHLRNLYALFVPPRHRWVEADTEVAPPPPTLGYPEIKATVPSRKAWLRALFWRN